MTVRVFFLRHFPQFYIFAMALYIASLRNCLKAQNGSYKHAKYFWSVINLFACILGIYFSQILQTRLDKENEGSS